MKRWQFHAIAQPFLIGGVVGACYGAAHHNWWIIAACTVLGIGVPSIALWRAGR